MLLYSGCCKVKLVDKDQTSIEIRNYFDALIKLKT